MRFRSRCEWTKSPIADLGYPTGSIFHPKRQTALHSRVSDLLGGFSGPTKVVCKRCRHVCLPHRMLCDIERVVLVIRAPFIDRGWCFWKLMSCKFASLGLYPSFKAWGDPRLAESEAVPTCACRTQILETFGSQSLARVAWRGGPRPRLLTTRVGNHMLRIVH